MYYNENMLPLAIQEEKDGYIIKAIVPGVKKEEINVVYESDVLTITADINLLESKESLVYNDIPKGNYRRKLRLPNINFEKTSARYDDGVLTIKAPVETRRLTIA